MLDLVDIAIAAAGWAGAIATVGAYALVTQRRIEPDSMLYQTLNLGGASTLAVSATASGAWPSLAVNVVWVAIGFQAVLAMKRSAISGRLHAGVRALPALAALLRELRDARVRAHELRDLRLVSVPAVGAVQHRPTLDLALATPAGRSMR